MKKHYDTPTIRPINIDPTTTLLQQSVQITRFKNKNQTLTNDQALQQTDRYVNTMDDVW